VKSWNPFYRWSIRAKIMLLIIGTSMLFGAGLLGFISYEIQNILRDEAINKTLIVADGLAVKAVDPVQVEDLNALLTIQGEAISRPEVAYCFIRDGRGRALSSSFEGNAVPTALKNINLLKPGVPFAPQSAVVTLRDGIVEVIDIASPIAGGTLGAVHVGLNMTLVKANTRSLLLYILGVGALALVALTAVSLAGSVMITKPMQDLMRTAESLDRGDLSKKAFVKTGDELGRLGETLNLTIDRLQGMARTETDRDTMQHRVMGLLSVVSIAAEGDLTVKAEVTADAPLGSLADAFNRVITDLTTLVTQASTVAVEIRRSAAEMLHATERALQGAEQQSSQIRNVSGTMDTLSQSTHRMIENAEAAAQTADKATQAAVKGGTAVAETITGMQRIRATVQSSGKKIRGLGERSFEIGATIEAINEIATQTHLLALNAAIEAVHAGEQGRGFTVIADEMRHLAERSARAAKDIARLIKGIQAETSEAVTVMEEGVREVQESAKVADQAGAALREIEQMVKQTSSLMREITKAAGDQVKSTESAAQTVGAIAHLTQETAHGVRDTEATISGLADLARSLNDALGDFKLGREHHAPVSRETSLPPLDGYPPLADQVTTSDEEIKLGFIE
jgi:methyl-accepting chemotaxis protein